MRFPNHPELSHLIATLVGVWPDHETFLAKRFKDCDVSDLGLCETLADIIMTLAGEGLEDYCHDYQWTCNLLMEEELYFGGLDPLGIPLLPKMTNTSTQIT